MNIMLAGIFGGWEVVLILAVALLIFGPKKLPELAKGLGQSIKEFKKSTREVTDELQNAMDDNTPPPPPAPKKLAAPTVVTTEAAQTVPQSSPGSKA